MEAGREIFFANAYPGMRGTAGYEEVVVPENFLRHELARVPPGGYFVAALVDYRPPNLLSRKREDASGAFSFLTTCGRIPVAAKLGTAVVLVGRREGDDVRVYVVPRRGRARFAFRVPPAWGPEGRPLVSFAAEIAPSKKIRAFTLGLPTRRYHLAAPGVIFVPANGRFQPAGEPALYWGDSLNLHRIYHFTAPR